MKHAPGVFLASTGRHIGKTTACLGLYSALRKRFDRIGFVKPVGQKHAEIAPGVRVDKDILLVRDVFGLETDPVQMSPVVFPPGYTREYLDHDLGPGILEERIINACNTLSETSQLLLVEGTGHVGVGSIAGISNARVAQILDVPAILIASGGIGSTFDSLALNKALFDQHGVRVVGVILNRVIPEKREMIVHYVSRALERWNVPLLGAIPFDELLDTPCMADFEALFSASLATGTEHRYRHFDRVRLVATTNEVYEHLMERRQLTITPASREDIIISTLNKVVETQNSANTAPPEPGIILTGRYAPRPEIVHMLTDANIPMLYLAENSFTVMQMIVNHTAKTNAADAAKVRRTLELVETHVDLDTLLKHL